MTSLLDIAPITETVDIRGSTLVLHGITNSDMAVLMRRFPLFGRQSSGMPTDPDEAMVIGIEMMPALIAAGLGQLGNPEIEAAVDQRLSSTEMIEVLGVVMRLTNPGQEISRPLAGAAGGDGAGLSGAAPATK